jgi:hypothetical protein
MYPIGQPLAVFAAMIIVQTIAAGYSEPRL